MVIFLGYAKIPFFLPLGFFPCFAHVFEYVILLEIPLCNMIVGCDWNFMYSGHLNLICNFVPMVNIPYSFSSSITCINSMDVDLLNFFNKIVFPYIRLASLLRLLCSLSFETLIFLVILKIFIKFHYALVNYS